MIEAPNSVLLLVGREEFTPASTFAGKPCVATADCLAVGVMSVDDAPALVMRGGDADTTDLIRLGDFELETEGQFSVRDVYNREYEAIGVEPGRATVTVWGNDDAEPCEVIFRVHSLQHS